VDQEKAQEAAERLFLDRFSLDDMREQFQQVMRMGNVRDLLKRLPGAATLSEEQMGELPENDDMRRMVAVIQSMTPRERMDPSLLHMQRRHRVARGSGTSVNDVSEVIKAHREMSKQVKEMKKTFFGRVAARSMEKQKKKRLDRLKKEGSDLRAWFGTAGGGAEGRAKGN
jgi:signal recognition particle subunit SRP54